jgi:hypothetical protein
MLCNHVTQLAGLISAVHDGETDPHLPSFLVKHGLIHTDMFLPSIISTGVMESVCLYRDSIFSTSYNIGKLSLLFLWHSA